MLTLMSSDQQIFLRISICEENDTIEKHRVGGFMKYKRSLFARTKSYNGKHVTFFPRYEGNQPHLQET